MFKIGNRFYYDDGLIYEEYMLVDLLDGKINMVNLKTGQLYTTWEVYVNDLNSITEHDMKRLLGKAVNYFGRLYK